MLEEKRKETIAMLLAGGQGSRLYVLTSKIAKPAVPFGGKYRIIDFTLSNCVNSGIDTVGVLTQYQPLILNDYIGNGQPWDLDRLYGGVHILPPYQKTENSDWYTGTANAVYQNAHFIERYHPEYVVVLSGDHIYKMDYSKMVKYHKEKGAAATIAVIEVPMEEASRFGILNTREDGGIYEFEEKPEHPKNNMASMGVYVFTWKVLRQYLEKDEQNVTSKKDFGKNVIPEMLEGGEKLYAYPFQGYWKDVGTIQSLWQANMDLLNDSNLLGSENWKIYSRHYNNTPQFVGENATIKNAIITEGCEIEGTVEDSVLFAGVKVKKGAYIKDSVVMANTVVGENSQVNYSMIDEYVTIGKDVSIGEEKSRSKGLTVLGKGVEVKDGQVIGADIMMGNK